MAFLSIYTKTSILYVSSTIHLFGIGSWVLCCLGPGDGCRKAFQTLTTISHMSPIATATKVWISVQLILWSLDLSINSKGPTAICQQA